MPDFSDSATLFLWLCLVLCGCSGEPSAELLAQLQADDAKLRRDAVDQLAKLDPENQAVTTALASAMANSDPHVRRIAIQALRQRTEQVTPHLPVLIDRLEDTDPSVRPQAALTLLAIDPTQEQAIAVLEEALFNSHVGVFAEVGKLGANGRWAVPTLIKILSDPLMNNRVLAARTLGNLGPVAQNAQPALEKALQDPEKIVRQAAEQALQRITAKPPAGQEESQKDRQPTP